MGTKPELKKTFGAVLPCPKCQKLNPIESRICTCGNWLIEPSVESQIKPFWAPKSEGVDFPFRFSRPRLVSSRNEDHNPALKAVTNERKRKFYLVAAALLVFVFASMWLTPLRGLITSWESRGPVDDSIRSGSKIDPELDSHVVTGREEQRNSADAPKLTTTPGEVQRAPSTQSAERSLVVLPESNPSQVHRNSNDDLATSKTDATKLDQPIAGVEPSTGKDETKAKGPSRNPIARCGDGTFSFAGSHTGACLYRGAVAEWMDGSGKPIPTTNANKTSPALKSSGPELKYQLGPRGGCYFINASGNKVYVDKGKCEK